jgi:DNA repair exonuclease SbcCD ATPase subunit
MLGTWKTRFQSLIADQDGAARQSNGAEDSQTRTLRLLADFKSSLNGVSANDSPSEEPPVAGVAAVETTATIAVRDAAPDFEPARRFVAEHRQTVESLLHKLGTLEECVKSQATASSAFQEYADAKQLAAEAATQEQHAKALVEESVERHRATKRELKDANELVEPARAEAQAAKDRLAQLEQQLRDAQQLVERKIVALEECEARAKECAAREAAAVAEATKAAEHHAACQSATATAQQQAKAAKERAETLKMESGGQSVAAISDVQELALKIAHGAAALNGSSSNSR